MDRISRGVRRGAAQIAWDTTSWLIALVVAWVLRYDFQPDSGELGVVLGLACSMAVTQWMLGLVFALYRGRYRTGSLDEVGALTGIVAVVSMSFTAYVVLTQPAGIPRSLPLLGGILALLLMMTARITVRVGRIRFRGANAGSRTLIYGAGHAGEHLVRLMLSDPARLFHPVGLLDDAPSKRGQRLFGVKVLGGIDALETAAAEKGASTLVVAITRVTAAQLRELEERCRRVGLELRVVPRADELLTHGVQLGDLSHVTVEDLLGRAPIETDLEAISHFIRGKRVLITGAGGSIGSELARQVDQYEPEYLGLLDRDESGLQAVELSLNGRGLLQSESLILADIRDRDRMHEVMAAVAPDVIFHAAALKHLSLLEKFPEEAFKTNILGTAAVLEAARAHRVKTFVNISTDKAADPTSVLGTSKRVTERLASGAVNGEGTRYLSVRFGNVLGSRGSVLNTFRAQIDAGGPVTVTDPDVTRYFMTVKEAVQLVLQAATLGDHGFTYIFDMGEPMRIDDVARKLIDMSGKQVDVVYTGLRPGEKANEVLTASEEHPRSTGHPLITQVSVGAIPIKTVQQANPGPSQVVGMLRAWAMTAADGDVGVVESFAPAPERH